MGDHLNRLNKIMDEQISADSVFNEKDEQNILREIQEQKKRPVLNRRSFVPALLTVALFAGLLLVSFTYLDEFFQPKQQAVQDNKELEMKEDKESKENEKVADEKEVKEEKPEELSITYDAYFTDPNGGVEINKETGTLKIWGGFINLAEKESPQFAVKANILNPNLESALKELSFYFADARYANTQHDEVFQFLEEVPLLKDVTKEELENKVQLAFIVDDKVVKTHVIKEVHVIEKSVTPVEESMKIEEIKKNLKLGMTQKEVKALFGDKYTAVEGAKGNENFWRFDLGADPGYTFSPENKLPDAIDDKGLLDGTVDTILFVEWDENLKVNSFSFYNMLEYGFKYTYRVFPDGTVKEDRADSGGIED
ncbi:hypothetical protein [Fictibacillus sp. BK138]|uniref:hypothetical protein n=1 Tax=Fictibacillus sp. BK138 TaxID=2512121 RepID=UPI001029F224|nr:hypothetical protein [Fictibacillus sp. BK138]RZT21350.1 hypothetical protein EV282_0409 [Fictibacillus sp. BK138]